MFASRLVIALSVVAGLLPTLGVPNPAHADGAFRTVLVIDASSSMKRTDPGELRKVAAELFVDLARRGDEIAVTEFDESARRSTSGFVVIDGIEARQQLKAAIRGIGNSGKWTDFTAGLREAKAVMETANRRSHDQELIVFLTDGRCEPDPKGPLAEKAKSRRELTGICKQMVLDTIAPSLRGARVYAIGLSKNAPRDFLEELGRRTGGEGVVTLDAKTLPQLFAGVYARLLGSRLQEGDADGKATFEVYEGAHTLDLVIVGRAGKTGTLRDPSSGEIAIDNREPDKIYFVAATEYRFYKIHKPRAGIWTLETVGKGERRYANLQHFDLALSFIDPQAAVEKGGHITLRAHLASPSGTPPPAEFLARHSMALVITSGEHTIRQGMKPNPDSTFTATYTPTAIGTVDFALELKPKSGGVLSRTTGKLHTLTVIPPVYLAAKPVEFGDIKQGESARANLDMAGSKVGAPLTLALSFTDESGAAPAGLTLTPTTLTLAEKGETSFPLTLEVDRDKAAGGVKKLRVRVTPTSPEGFAERAIDVELAVHVVPLSFWERYGKFVQYGAGGLVLLIILLGIVTPAKFKKRAILYYVDIRDPEMARRSSYPLGAKGKRGFFRAARIAVGPSGPVKKGGAVVLRARSGGAVEAVPASSSATVFRAEIPTEDDDVGGDFASPGDDDDRPRVPLKKGCFRVGAGVGYEIKGSGFVFWYK